MTRKFFNLTSLSLVLFGVLLLVAAPNLCAQPAAPAAPVIGLTAVPYPTPSQYVTPTELIFTLTMTDTTDGATIVFNVTGPNGQVTSGSISAPNFSSTPYGTVTVTVPLNATSGYTATAYAYIPQNNSTCPVTPPSANSATTTASF